MSKHLYICPYCEGKGVLIAYTQENYYKYAGRWSQCPPDWQAECEDCLGSGLVPKESHLQWEPRVKANQIDPQGCPIGLICQTMSGAAERLRCPNSWQCIDLADSGESHD